MRTAFAVLLTLPLAAQNWPSFRGPLASGIADGQKLPDTWDGEKKVNIKWKTAIPGLGHSSPVVWADKIFVSTAISGDPNTPLRLGLYGAGEPVNDSSVHMWKVYGLDRRTGRVLWEQTAHEVIPKIKRHPKSTHASSTPATDGRRAVFLFGSEGLYCYDIDGKLLWKQDLGVLDAGAFDVPEFQWGNASSPIIYKNLVIVQSDIQKNSFISAYDVNDGHRVWTTPRESAMPSWGTPSVFEVNGRPVLVTNGHEYMRGYDPMTGRELWRLKNDSYIANPTPVFAHGLFFVTAGYRPSKPIYAIRASATGDISLNGAESNEHVAWSKKINGPYIPTPLVYGDYLYACAINGVLTCFNARTGEQMYQQRIGGGGAYSASPVASSGRIYLPSEDGDIFVVKAGPVYEQIGVNRMSDTLMATPAIAGGMMIVRGRGHVYGIGR